MRLIAGEAVKRKLAPQVGVGEDDPHPVLQSHELKPWPGKKLGCTSRN